MRLRRAATKEFLTDTGYRHEDDLLLSRLVAAHNVDNVNRLSKRTNFSFEPRQYVTRHPNDSFPNVG